MRFLILLTLAVLLGLGGASAAPLTSPITTTATTYQLADVQVDVTNCVVSWNINLVDAGGAVVRSVHLSDTCSALGITPAQQTAIQNAVIVYSKTKAAIN